jgi:hypothetical protein
MAQSPGKEFANLTKNAPNGAFGPPCVLGDLENVPAAWRDFVALNAEMAAICPPIVERKEPLAKCRSAAADAGSS